MVKHSVALTKPKEWLYIEKAGVVPFDRVVAIARVESAPIRRLLETTPPSHLITLTGGRKRKTVLVLDSGHLIISPLTVTQLLTQMKTSQKRLIPFE